jgi:hypothetical protein
VTPIALQAVPARACTNRRQTSIARARIAELGLGTSVALSAGMQLRTTSLALALAVGVAGSACVITESDSSLYVANHSDFEIHEMYVTPIESPTWGRNLLGNDILLPGGSMYVALDCGTYDALLVDETGATCEVQNLDLCFDDADWIIRNNTCAVFESARAAPADAK